MILTNARILEGFGSEPLQNATIVLRDGKIESISGAPAPEGAEVVDLGGRFVLPGLINAHVHVLMEPKGGDTMGALARESDAATALRSLGTVRRMVAAGITTARDLGGKNHVDLALRDAINRGDVVGPRLLCAGKLITMTGGHGWPIGREADGPDEVRKAVREQLKAGADVIKLMATGGVLTPGVEPGSPQLAEAELRAGIEEAHHAGRRTASHAQGNSGIKNAIRAGIDTIEHGIFLDQETVDMMAERGVFLVATLAAPYQIVAAGLAAGIPAHAVEKSERVTEDHFRSFELAARSGVPIAAGNDGGTPFNPCEDLVTELRLMAAHGLSNLQALQAATHGAAVALGIETTTGTIAPGLAADLLILDADPLADINNLAKVWMVIKRGETIRDA